MKMRGQMTYAYEVATRFRFKPQELETAVSYGITTEKLLMKIE